MTTPDIPSCASGGKCRADCPAVDIMRRVDRWRQIARDAGDAITGVENSRTRPLLRRASPHCIKNGAIPLGPFDRPLQP